MAIFRVGEEQNHRTVDGVVASEDAVIGAAVHMVRRMRDELWGYFGIAAVSADDGRAYGVSYRQCTLTLTDNTAAYGAAASQVAQGVRRRMSGQAPVAVEQEVNVTLNNRWGVARNRLLTFLGSGTVVLATRSYQRPGWAIAGGETLGAGHTHANVGRILMNPFAWFHPDGTRTMTSSTERARAAHSPTLHLLHEIGHVQGCLFSGTWTACNEENNSRIETTSVDDVDEAVRDHPGIGLRHDYLGGPGERVYMDDAHSTEPATRSPGRGVHYVEFPSENTLRTGR